MQHKFSTYIIVLILILGLSSCDFKKSISYNFESASNTSANCDTCLEHNNNPSYDVHYQKLTTKDSLAIHTNAAVSKAIIDIILSEERTAATIEEALDIYVTNSLNAYPEDANLYTPYELEIDAVPVHSTNDILSIQITHYQVAGGAHGYGGIKYLNFNAQEGTEIRFVDTVTDWDGFYAFAKAQFITTHGAISDYWFTDASFALPENIGFTQEGVHLVYNSYEIAPYAQGMQELVLAWDDVKNYLNVR